MTEPQTEQPQQINWHSEKRKISDLIPAPYNPRKWPENETKNLTASLEKFSLADPLVINRNNTIIGGHFRFKLLKDKGLDEIDVRVPNRLLDEAEERELNIRLNRNLGLWDFDALANFDEDLLKEIGFDSKELDKIFQIETAPEDDDVPDARPTTDIKLGDIFQLGEHRLMCGDSTKKQDVEKLMGGEKADMVLTDPPYGINLDTDYSSMTSANSFASGKKHNSVIGDDEPFDATFLMEMADEIILFGADYYVDTLPNYGKDGSWMIWDKREGDSQDKGFGSNFEMLWSKIKHKRWMLRQTWFGFFTGGEKREYKHPTCKPVNLLIEVMEKIKAKYIILDLFGGSGSTLIACEKLNRKCRMMEIAPVYCQVIVDRWEKFTGKKSEKI